MNRSADREWPKERTATGPQVAARGPRRQPGKSTDALVLAWPLRAGTARGPNLIGSRPNACATRKGGATHEPERPALLARFSCWMQ
jgi:hypothetical protein